MQTIKQYGGLCLIVAGVAALAATRTDRLSGSNALLLTGLVLVVAGVAAHIGSLKSNA